jgi:hypothetical protein
VVRATTIRRDELALPAVAFNLELGFYGVGDAATEQRLRIDIAIRR